MSDLTRRDAMKLAAGASLATAVAASADHGTKDNGGKTKGNQAEIKAYINLSHGVQVTVGGTPLVAGAKKLTVNEYTHQGVVRYEYEEPVHKARVSFPKAGFGYLAICYSAGGVYVNAFYATEAESTAKWCCVRCGDLTVCGPGVCVTCNGVTICC